MRFSRIVPLLPLASAFVITEPDVFSKIEKSGRQLVDNAQNVLDDALSKLKHDAKDAYRKIHHPGFDAQAWLESERFDGPRYGPPQGPPPDGPPRDGPHYGPPPPDDGHHGQPPHDGPRGPPPHGPPPHGPPPHGPPPHDKPHDKPPHGPPPHEKPPHGKPPHGPPPHGPPHHGKPHSPPNRTVYELINESKYTTKLAKMINEFDDLVELLNGTSANYTIFAPIDEAFEKIPKHHPKPSKEFLKDLLTYHVVDEFYPAGRVLKSYTIPTLYTTSKNLGHAQRLVPKVTLKGPTINYYSRLVAVDIFGTNGVVHGVSSILVPPPPVATIINLLPGEFSTLELALSKTGLFDKMNNTDYKHNGGTLFAPSNFAFKKLGPRANAFLFSKYGEKYLKALLEYHMVVDQTLYSDAFFDGTKDDAEAADLHSSQLHYDLPTLLSDKYLSIDVGRWGPFLEIRVNGFSRVTVSDGVAADGVIQVVSNVLIPPKKAGSEQVFWNGEELDVDDLKERLQPYVDNDNIEL